MPENDTLYCDAPPKADQTANGLGYPVPDNETARLESLWNLKILDTPSDERFDRVVRLAAAHFHMPVCRISFVDQDRNWFKAKVGVNATEAPRSIAICSHAIMEGKVLVAPDLAEDPRFSESPQVVSGPKFRFYAGAPIILDDGMPVGSLCIIDYVPRPEFSPEDAAYLEDLAKIVVDELELHKQIVDKDQKLKMADEELDTANGAKSRFLAIVSHELRTPLNAIMGFGKLIADGNAESETDAQYREFAQHICDASEQLKTLVDRILLYSSAKTDALKLCESDVNIELLVLKCIDRVASDAVGAKAAVSLSKDTDIPKALHADEILVGEVILQLLNNAVEHTKPGTEVVIALRKHTDGGLSISVLDTGEGIEVAEIEGTFDAFHQGEDVLTRANDGIGLGLSIAKALIEMHDGSLQLSERDGGGVCAEIVFPASRNRTSAEFS